MRVESSWALRMRVESENCKLRINLRVDSVEAKKEDFLSIFVKSQKNQKKKLAKKTFQIFCLIFLIFKVKLWSFLPIF